jgi:hypothetical protein
MELTQQNGVTVNNEDSDTASLPDVIVTGANSHAGHAAAASSCWHKLGLVASVCFGRRDSTDCDGKA